MVLPVDTPMASYPSPLNYYQFPKSVCTSVNEVICHGIPDFREVQDGDIVNIDISVYNSGGYHGDLNETFCVGDVDEDGRRVVQTSFECIQAAMEIVKPGTLYRDLGNSIEKVAKKNKYVFFASKILDDFQTVKVVMLASFAKQSISTPCFCSVSRAT
jgi:methionine aminopeptidase